MECVANNYNQDIKSKRKCINLTWLEEKEVDECNSLIRILRSSPFEDVLLDP